MRLSLVVATAFVPGYGFMADELYYLSCVDHLAWGYVDHPPFSIGLLSLARELLGDSLVALRIVAGVIGGAAVVGAGLLARELGGGRRAQLLASLAFLAAPGVQAVGSYYSMNVIESLLWIAIAGVVARLVSTDGAGLRGWCVVGLLLGVGLLNKLSTVWLGAGLGLGLLLTARRVWLGTPGPWLAAAIAGGVAVPHLGWQLANDWPLRGFIEGYAREVEQTGAVLAGPAEFVAAQILAMNPFVLPIWGLGLLAYFRNARLRPFQLLAWMWIGVAGILLVSGRAQAYYLLPAFPILLAAGGVVLETRLRDRPKTFVAVAASLAVGGALVLPIAMPLLSPTAFERLQQGLGIPDEDGQLPEHFGWRVGWPELVRAVAAARARMPGDVRLLTTGFPTASALDQLGRDAGLPRPMGTHNAWWSWGPTGPTNAPVIIVTSAGHPILADFGDVEAVAGFECAHCLVRLREQRIFLARDPRAPIRELWPAWKDFR